MSVISKSPGRPTRNQGLGLIELMIALALGVIIMLGVSEVATQNSITRNEIERSGRQIETASFALRMIENDITNSGFWGEAGAQSAGGALPLLCAGQSADSSTAFSQLSETLGFPVQGVLAAGETSCISPKANSNFLAIRRASSCVTNVGGCDGYGAEFQIQVNACFEPDDDSAMLPGVIMFAEGDDLSPLVGTQRDCTTAAPHYRFLNRIYYIDDDDQLRRSDLSGSTPGAYGVGDVLAEGVEQLRFEYGLDNVGGDGLVDEVVTSPVGLDWAEVTMVRVSMVVRNLQASPDYTDDRTYTVGGVAYTVPVAFQNHKRQLYVRTVSLRNVAGRREVQ